MATKATNGNLWYGPSRYPIHDSNLPSADFDPIIEAVTKAIHKASNFPAEGPIVVECRIAGNGWDVTFEVGMDGLIEAAAAERMAASLPSGARAAR